MQTLLRLLILLALLWPGASWAAVAIGTPVANANNAAATTISVSTTAAGSDRGLTAVVMFCPGCGGAGTLDSVVFNTSESFTFECGQTDGADNRVEIWTLRNPSATTANTTATFSNSKDATITVVPMTGVDQTDMSRSCSTASKTSSTTHSDSASTANGDYVVDGLAHWISGGGSGKCTADGGQTETLDASMSDIEGCASYRSSTGASETMGWTLTGASTAAHAWVSIQPSGGGGGATVRTLILMGVGQ